MPKYIEMEAHLDINMEEILGKKGKEQKKENEEEGDN